MKEKPLDCVAVKGDVGKHDFQPCPTEPIVHAAVEPRGTGERYCSEKIAELVMTQSQLAKAIAERDALKAALDKIASWGEGPVVTGMFDEPASAKMAREVLAKLASGELRKPAA